VSIVTWIPHQTTRGGLKYLAPSEQVKVVAPRGQDREVKPILLVRGKKKNFRWPHLELGSRETRRVGPFGKSFLFCFRNPGKLQDFGFEAASLGGERGRDMTYSPRGGRFFGRTKVEGEQLSCQSGHFVRLQRSRQKIMNKPNGVGEEGGKLKHS